MEGWEGLVPLKPKSAIETWSVQPTSLPRNILRYYRLYFPSGCCARGFSHNFFFVLIRFLPHAMFSHIPTSSQPPRFRYYDNTRYLGYKWRNSTVWTDLISHVIKYFKREHFLQAIWVPLGGLPACFQALFFPEVKGVRIDTPRR